MSEVLVLNPELSVPCMAIKTPEIAAISKGNDIIFVNSRPPNNFYTGHVLQDR